MVLEMEMSKTYQYRKVMKPMLERKRRARINKCLDELKDIMVECLTQEGEHITRLEKADILELTVEHMKKLKQQKQLRLNQNQQSSPIAAASIAAQKMSIAESFRAGYVHAANEVSKALASVPGVSVELGTQLMSHLGHRLNYLQVVLPPSTSPTASTSSVIPNINNNVIASTSPTALAIQGYTNVHPFNTSLYFDENNNNNIKNKNSSNIYNDNRSTPINSIITPPPSECSNSSTSDRGSTYSPTPSEANSVWRPW